MGLGQKVVTELQRQELRAGYLGIKRRYEPLDFLGVALGAFFIWDAVAKKKAPQWVPIALGSIMVYIHSRRFFYAPKDAGGALRLLRDVGVTSEELEQLRQKVANDERTRVARLGGYHRGGY